MYAKNVTLDGDVFRNTGFIFADKITVNADTLQTGKRYADLGNTLSWQDAKHWTLTYGEQIQEGGFMSAADYAFNGEKIICESCTFQRTGENAEQTTQLSAELMTQLRGQYGANLSETELIDRAVHEMHTSVKKGFFQSTLGMVVIIIVAIVLSVVTAGAATAAMAGFVSSAASTAGAAAAAAAAASGATGMACAAAGAAAASAAAATASAITGAIAAAVGAAASSLGTQLLSTGRVNWSSVGKSAVTAGVTAGLTSAVFGASGAASGAQSGAQSTATWGDKIVNAGGRAVVSATVNTAVNGGSFGTAVGNAFVNNMGAYASSGIGDYFTAPENASLGGEGSIGHVVAHSGLAAVTAKLTGQDVEGAAIGGAVGAFSAPILNGLLNPDKVVLDDEGVEWKLPTHANDKWVSVGTQVLGASAAIFAGRDGESGKAAAQNVVDNNFLSHREREKLLELRAKGDDLSVSEKQLLLQLERADQLSDGLLNKLRRGDPLTATEEKNLSFYLGNYRNQEGSAATTLSLNASTLSLNASTLSNAGLLMAGKPAPGQGPNANYLDSLSAPGATVGQLQLNIDGALTNSGQIAATGDITARSANLNTPSGSSLAIWR